MDGCFSLTNEDSEVVSSVLSSQSQNSDFPAETLASSYFRCPRNVKSGNADFYLVLTIVFNSSLSFRVHAESYAGLMFLKPLACQISAQE